MTTTLFELVNFVRDLKSKTKIVKIKQRRSSSNKRILNKYKKKVKYELTKRIINKYHCLQYKLIKYDLKITNILKYYDHIVNECLYRQDICCWLNFDLFF